MPVARKLTVLFTYNRVHFGPQPCTSFKARISRGWGYEKMIFVRVSNIDQKSPTYNFFHYVRKGMGTLVASVIHGASNVFSAVSNEVYKTSVEYRCQVRNKKR